MPRQNGKARWVQQTIDAAMETARHIMDEAKLEDSPNSYIDAGYHAAMVIVSAVELVEFMESKAP